MDPIGTGANAVPTHDLDGSGAIGAPAARYRPTSNHGAALALWFSPPITDGRTARGASRMVGHEAGGTGAAGTRGRRPPIERTVRTGGARRDGGHEAGGDRGRRRGGARMHGQPATGAAPGDRAVRQRHARRGRRATGAIGSAAATPRASPRSTSTADPVRARRRASAASSTRTPTAPCCSISAGPGAAALASAPEADLRANTTAHLIADIEALRRLHGVERWTILGLSWGTTLGLAYAQAHPRRVDALVLGLVTNTSRREVEWITRDVGRIFPQEWDRFAAAVPERLRHLPLVDAYATLLADPDPAVRDHAARSGAPGKTRTSPSRPPAEPALGVPPAVRAPGHALLAARRLPRGGPTGRHPRRADPRPRRQQPWRWRLSRRWATSRISTTPATRRRHPRHRRCPERPQPKLEIRSRRLMGPSGAAGSGAVGPIDRRIGTARARAWSIPVSRSAWTASRSSRMWP